MATLLPSRLASMMVLRMRFGLSETGEKPIGSGFRFGMQSNAEGHSSRFAQERSRRRLCRYGAGTSIGGRGCLLCASRESILEDACKTRDDAKGVRCKPIPCTWRARHWLHRHVQNSERTRPRHNGIRPAAFVAKDQTLSSPDRRVHEQESRQRLVGTFAERHRLWPTDRYGGWGAHRLFSFPTLPRGAGAPGKSAMARIGETFG